MEIGKQIRELRIKQNIKLKDLAIGITTDESLRNIELGKEAINKFLMEIIFQRLGKSTDKLEMIVSEEIYREELLKAQYEDFLEQGEAQKASEVLETFMKCVPKESRVHKMYYCRSKAYAEFRLGKNPIAAKQWIQRAIDITLPNWKMKELKQFCISNIEMENLLMYSKLQIISGTEYEIEEAEKRLLECRDYIDERITDGEAHAKISVKCMHLLAEMYLKKGKITEAELLAKQALLELREYGISYFMQPVLEMLVCCSDKKNNGECELIYRKYLKSLIHIKEHVCEAWRFEDAILKNCSQQTYYIDNELFREERIVHGYSQEAIIEGIYKNPESLSRAERGEVTVRDTRLKKLFQKLEIEKSRYNSFIVTDTYEVLELKQRIDILLSQKKDTEAEKVIEELKEKLDQNVSENRRVIKGYEIMLNRVTQRVAFEELLSQALDLLHETYHLKTNGVYRAPMDREAILLNQIGILLRQIGKEEEAKRLFYNVTESMRKSKVSLRNRYRTYSLLMTNLAKWECSVIMAQENIKFDISCGKLRSIAMNYMIEACALIEEPRNKELCREMIQDVYYLCELENNDVDKKITEKYYERKFGEKI